MKLYPPILFNLNNGIPNTITGYTIEKPDYERHKYIAHAQHEGYSIHDWDYKLWKESQIEFDITDSVSNILQEYCTNASLHAETSNGINSFYDISELSERLAVQDIGSVDISSLVGSYKINEVDAVLIKMGSLIKTSKPKYIATLLPVIKKQLTENSFREWYENEIGLDSQEKQDLFVSMRNCITSQSQYHLQEQEHINNDNKLLNKLDILINDCQVNMEFFRRENMESSELTSTAMQMAYIIVRDIIEKKYIKK